MPTSYTTLLGLALPVQGELQGTWGDEVNNYITNYLDASVAGTQTLTTDADVTLTKTTGTALTGTSSQYAILNCTGARTAARNITAPAASKAYVVINGTTGGFAVTLRGAGPTTGVSIAAGERAVCVWNGSDFVKAASSTGSPGGSNTQVQYNNAGALAGSANLTFDGTTLTANSATVSTGNLTFSSTAQRITGDFSNATVANRLSFQSSTTNGNTVVHAIPNGTSAIASYRTYNAADPTNAAFNSVQATSAEAQIVSGISGTGTYLPMTFFTGGSERVRIDTSGNVGIGGTPSVGGVRLTVLGGGTQLSPGTTAQEGVRIQRATGYATFNGINNDNNAYNGLQFFTGASAAVTIDTSGNVGIGASPSYVLDVYRSSTTTASIAARNDTSTTLLYATNAASFVGTTTNTPFGFITNNTEQLRILATGGITSANLADAVGYKGTPLNEQSAAYTLVIGDQGKSIVHPASDNNARTFTIPANGSVAFPVGTTITFINMINTVTIAITTDTMYLAGAGTTGSRTLAAYGMATAVKMTSTTWIISGNGLS